ncbi:MAG: MBL fold metallo-hydrolase, partial [Halorubrum sp.]
DPERIDRDVESIESLATDYEVIRVDDETEVELSTPAGSVTVWTVAAYNDPNGPCADENGDVPHPEGFGCGFLFAVGGRTVFWPGDSDALDGFAELDVSVFLANIGGGGIVSDRHESAALAEQMNPEIVVPIHYDTFPALAADGEAFAGDVASRSIPVALDARSANQ